ncbi:hypothetical protein A7P85_01475 [Eikenella corrodens]|uniref:Uncharacterized protein n=1 Tax=Eikenella corrodens TaxID=539 RepID=A0A1A9RJ77_EIKCO|nr:hypothetical protein [Eikenella corrodens]OAM18375.1 hypothetical protein A7P85_01475 [Eikenella corrodens]OAM25188.1 hypothetical protein A7P92_00880 [Eikenella corrodens]
MFKKLLPALFLLALIPSAAANGPTYSTRDLFISRCTGETATTGISRQSAANICACTFDQISSRYGSNWPQALDSQDIGSNPELTRFIDTATRQCVSRHAPR